MTDIDFELQYHLVIDINDITLKKCLFQLHEISTSIEITFKFLSNEKMMMFFSFRWQNVEIKYNNSKQKCYAIVKTLAEIR